MSQDDTHTTEELHDPLADDMIIMRKSIATQFLALSVWHKTLIIGGGALLFVIIVYKLFFQANFASTVYVDASVRTSGNGSLARPIKDLQTAIDQYNLVDPSSELDIILAGVHEGTFVLPELARVTGRDGDAPTIVGTLTIGREAILTAFRITGEGSGVIVPDGRVAIIEGVEVSDNDGSGIDAGQETNVVLRDITARNNSAKGISIGPGSRAEIVDSTVRSNAKEGIDLGPGVKGTLTNNTITDNAQSGVEYTLGGSIGVLRSNIIERNDTGVTVQFSAEAPLLGNVQVRDNVISNNREFGVACEQPRDGDRPERYYDNSTTFEFNEVRGNQNDPIAKKCGFDL